MSSFSLSNASTGNSPAQLDETTEPNVAARPNQAKAFPTRPRSRAPLRAASRAPSESNAPEETLTTTKLATETPTITTNPAEETPEEVNRNAQRHNPGRVFLKNSAKAHLLKAETTLRGIDVRKDPHESRRTSQRKRAEADQVLNRLKSALAEESNNVHQTAADDVHLLHEISQGVANMRRQVEEIDAEGAGLFKAMAAEQKARWVKDQVMALESILNPTKVLLRGSSR